MRAAWLLVVSFFLLTGCGGEPYFLEAYEIADLEIESGTRVSRRVTEPHTALGKPVEGKLSQRFVPVSDEYELEDIVDEIAAIAEDQGWILELDSEGCGAYGSARLALGQSDRKATLSIFCLEALTASQDDVVVASLHPVAVKTVD